MTNNEKELTLRKLPGIDVLLETKTAQRIERILGISISTRIARSIIDGLRKEVLKDSGSELNQDSREDFIRKAEIEMNAILESHIKARLHRVINATGVVIHTNLGRAPLSHLAKEAILNAAGVCNLELDLSTGKRGKRGAAAEDMLCSISGAEGALIVNNCAAATVLVLATFAKGGEAIISRGEMVEIGGDFRIPDVMKASGAKLVEVGTTNRTKLGDYKNAISANTNIILKVHPSNYRIVGFTESPRIGELATICREQKILLFEDAGSGALEDLSAIGFGDEPLISRSIAEGADVVTFSGDKLLGSVQAGLIVGKGEVIREIRNNPLYRAFRASKLVYAALEATLDSFQRNAQFEEVPVMKMIRTGYEELDKRARKFVERAEVLIGARATLEIIKGKSAIGGGAAPDVQPESPIILIRGNQMTAKAIEKGLRGFELPVIARVSDDAVVIDLRTVEEEDESILISALDFSLGQSVTEAASN